MPGKKYLNPPFLIFCGIFTSTMRVFVFFFYHYHKPPNALPSKYGHVNQHYGTKTVPNLPADNSRHYIKSNQLTLEEFSIPTKAEVLFK